MGFSTAKATANTGNLGSRPSAQHQVLGQQAVALIQQGRLKEAEAIYRRIIAAGVEDYTTYGNLGAICGMQGRLDELIELLRHALQLKPKYPEAHNNLGNALTEKGDLNAAIASFRNAINLRPNYPNAHSNLSMTLLLSGDYKNGLEHYEWRSAKERDPCPPHALPRCPRWDGKTLKVSERLLVVSEQGLGDTLQFMRYTHTLRKRGINVSLCAQPKLHSLIQTSGIDPSPLTPEEGNKVVDGYWIPILSLLRHLEVSPENPISTAPYIITTDQLSAKWSCAFAGEQRPIIGLNWQGAPEHEGTNSRGRSLPLEAFAVIAQQTNASLVSLQKGFGSEQRQTCSFRDRFIGCQEQVDEAWDFLETAAIIANCDLVITSDTSVAHLAAGMGQTTWLLLKKVPEWRWGLEGENSFWYPSVRLFRQKAQDCWADVLERVADALNRRFARALPAP